MFPYFCIPKPAYVIIDWTTSVVLAVDFVIKLVTDFRILSSPMILGIGGIALFVNLFCFYIDDDDDDDDGITVEQKSPVEIEKKLATI